MAFRNADQKKALLYIYKLLYSAAKGRPNTLKEQMNCQIEHDSQKRLSISIRNRMESEFKCFSVDQDLRRTDFF